MARYMAGDIGPDSWFLGASLSPNAKSPLIVGDNLVDQGVAGFELLSRRPVGLAAIEFQESNVPQVNRRLVESALIKARAQMENSPAFGFLVIETTDSALKNQLHSFLADFNLMNQAPIIGLSTDGISLKPSEERPAVLKNSAVVLLIPQ